jgi:ribosomal protein S7
LIVGGTLQQDRIKSLLKANDEAKPRRSTKSIVLGKAKVMSFEDPVEARTKRAEKEANKLTKKKRACSRKRKGSAAEACMPEPMIKAACTDKAPEPVELPIQDMEGSLMLARGRVPVARMY